MFRQRGPAQLQQTAPKGSSTAAPVMPAGGHKRLGDMLVDEGLITEKQLQDTIMVQRERGGFLGKLLVELGHTTQDQVVSCLVKQCKIPHLNLQDYDIDTTVFHLVPLEICRDYTLVPIDKLGRILTIAMVDPLNSDAIEAVRQYCPDLRIKPILCSWRDYESVLEKMSKSQETNSGGSMTTHASFGLVEDPKVKEPPLASVAASPAPVATPTPKAETPPAAPAAVDPLDTSQTMQRAGRSRTRPAEEFVTPASMSEEDSIGEEELRDIVTSAVENAISEVLSGLHRRLDSIERTLNSKAFRPRPVAQGAGKTPDAFKDLAQSMRRSFGLDAGKEAPTPEDETPIEAEVAEAGEFDGFAISSPVENQRFDNYFGGGNNDFTSAVCRKVSAHPGAEYNPLYLFGAIGAGKTHLANAIGNAMLAQNPDLRVGYLPAAQFLERMEQAIRFGQLETFRAYYGPWNALIFDDIDQIAGHNAAQEEMMHLVDVLVRRGCHLILVGHSAPDALMGIESRLKSRLCSGLTAEVKAPDLAGRKTLLSALAGEDQAILPEPVVQLLAESADEDVRAMIGRVRQVLAMVKLGTAPTDPKGLAEHVQRMLAESA